MASSRPPLSPGASPGARPARGPSLGPVVAGLLLDLADIATWGPLGLKIGLVVGAVAGWLLAPSLGVPPGARWLCALASGAYCMLPFTSFLPLGTLVGALVRLRERSQPAENAAPPTSASPPIEAEYRSRWEDE